MIQLSQTLPHPNDSHVICLDSTSESSPGYTAVLSLVQVGEKYLRESDKRLRFLSCEQQGYRIGDLGPEWLSAFELGRTGVFALPEGEPKWLKKTSTAHNLDELTSLE